MFPVCHIADTMMEAFDNLIFSTNDMDDAGNEPAGPAQAHPPPNLKRKHGPGQKSSKQITFFPFQIFQLIFFRGGCCRRGFSPGSFVIHNLNIYCFPDEEGP